MIETFIDDNFTNLTPLGRIISNNEIIHITKDTKKFPEFKNLIEEDKSAFEVCYIYLELFFFNCITYI